MDTLPIIDQGGTCGDAGVDRGGLILGRPRASFSAAPTEAPVEVVLIIGISPSTKVLVEEAFIWRDQGELGTLRYIERPSDIDIL